jgi:Mrp family chromosome partitioning ATPase
MLLAVIALAVFLVTRKSVRPADRYQVGVDVLIPAVDSKGARPQGVPGNLLQGQAELALSKNTEDKALDIANVPKKERSDIEFGFADHGNAAASSCTGNCSNVVTLSATANDSKTANNVANAFQAAYSQARAKTVADSAKSSQDSTLAGIKLLTDKLIATNQSIRKADPTLLDRLPKEPQKSAEALTASLPAGTSDATSLLVVQRNTLLSRISDARQNYANDVVNAVVPSAYASRLQVFPPAQVTPPLPSARIPILAFLGIGLVLALGIPILRDRLDRSIRTPKAAAAALDATVLTTIPPVTRRTRHSFAPHGSTAEEAYRALAATAIATDRLPEAILVTSPTGTLQDMVAANFAASLASLNMRVALVATNQRQTWFLNGKAGGASSSFPELLELAHQGHLNGEVSRGLVETGTQNLFVLPPGSANGDLSLDGLRPLLDALSKQVDVVVIAGPPLLKDPNATIFAWTTRSVLWTLESGDVTDADAKEAAARLALAGANPFGIVMINANR